MQRPTCAARRQVNGALGELREALCAWTIPDAALRGNLKDAVTEDFLPHYKVRVVAWGTRPGACRACQRAAKACLDGFCTADQAIACAVQAFMDKYSPEATPFTKHPEKYVRFSVADVQRIITEELFEGREAGGSMPAAKAAVLMPQLSKRTDSSA